MEQVIYSKFEIPIDKRMCDMYKNMFDEEYSKVCLQTHGVSVIIREAEPRAIVITTYDEEVDSCLLLKYKGVVSDLVYTNLRKSII